VDGSSTGTASAKDVGAVRASHESEEGGKKASSLSKKMGRRDFVAAIISMTAAWSLTVRAQQTSRPVIGFLHSGSPEQKGEVIEWAP